MTLDSSCEHSAVEGDGAASRDQSHWGFLSYKSNLVKCFCVIQYLAVMTHNSVKKAHLGCHAQCFRVTILWIWLCYSSIKSELWVKKHLPNGHLFGLGLRELTLNAFWSKHMGIVCDLHRNIKPWMLVRYFRNIKHVRDEPFEVVYHNFIVIMIDKTYLCEDLNDLYKRNNFCKV